MTKTETPNRPTHRVYAVFKRPDSDKGHRVEIGAAWAHRDGKGFNAKFDLMPLTDAEIVIREPRAEQAPAEAS